MQNSPSYISNNSHLTNIATLLSLTVFLSTILQNYILCSTFDSSTNSIIVHYVSFQLSTPWVEPRDFPYSLPLSARYPESGIGLACSLSPDVLAQ
ncbi:hypothetical protein BKA82DRAFT_18310 [Pisolithus tinctorius]|uniref:Uncharacterized protein n=1 Tax=Pisolithus tinctorius Marx 270 TaxID=870435 RepID=A0A0C3PX92_PISTI|nr:hypothetical protein BKA82DRAFT_18310 [Pisolithus tinctorius]KIO14046.1 hypothetical protein M404DRAFT_18310 [Pisolithus tinctorius Marx 270]